MALRQSADPAKWQPMTAADVAEFLRRHQDGRLTDMVEVRRFEWLRLLAEVERRSMGGRVTHWLRRLQIATGWRV